MQNSEPSPPGRSISELLREFVVQTTPQQELEHDLLDYAEELSPTKYVAKRLLRIGRNCVAVELIDGSILNLTKTRQLTPEMGTRPFDVPILQKRRWQRLCGRDLTYFIQPQVETPVTAAQHAAFTDRLQKLGYRYADSECDNIGTLGVYRGRVVLLDPWEVCCPRPVSELLREIDETDDGPPLYAIADILDGTRLRVWRVMWVGTDSVVLERVDGNVLKLTMRPLPDDAGSRPFDVPILERGKIPLHPQHRRPPSRKRRPAPQAGDATLSNVTYFVQPPVETPVSDDQLGEFFKIADSHGYALSDASVENLGIYAGRLVLIDPFAVRRRYKSIY